MLKLFSGSALLRVSGAAAQLLFTLLVSRSAGASQAGLFFFGYSILFITSTFARLGSELSGLRGVAQAMSIGDSRAARRIVDTRVMLVAGVSALTSLALVGAAPVISAHAFGRSAWPVIVCVAVALPALAIVGLMSEILKGFGHAWLALSIQNIAIPVLTVPGVAAISILAEPTALNLSMLVALCTWIVAATSVMLARRLSKQGGRGWHVDKHELVSTLKDAPSLLVVSTTSVVMQWIGATLLGFLGTGADVAGYSVAMRISIAVSIVHSAAASIVGPQMSVAHAAGDAPRLRRISQQTGLLITAITWPGLLLMLAFAPWCMAIFGHDYPRFAYVLRILLVGQLVAAVIGHSGLVLVMAGRYKSARRTSLVAAGSLAAFSFLAMPRLGAEGAAIAMAGAVILGHLAAVVLVRRELGISTVVSGPRDISDIWHHREEVKTSGDR